MSRFGVGVGGWGLAIHLVNFFLLENFVGFKVATCMLDTLISWLRCSYLSECTSKSLNPTFSIIWIEMVIFEWLFEVRDLQYT